MACDHIELFAMYGGAYLPVSCPYCANHAYVGGFKADGDLLEPLGDIMPSISILIDDLQSNPVAADAWIRVLEALEIADKEARVALKAELELKNDEKLAKRRSSRTRCSSAIVQS